MAGRAEICLREVNVTTGGRSSATSFHSPARGKPARKTQTSAFALVGDNESFRFFFSGNWSISCLDSQFCGLLKAWNDEHKYIRKI